MCRRHNAIRHCDVMMAVKAGQASEAEDHSMGCCPLTSDVMYCHRICGIGVSLPIYPRYRR